MDANSPFGDNRVKFNFMQPENKYVSTSADVIILTEIPRNSKLNIIQSWLLAEKGVILFDKIDSNYNNMQYNQNS